MLNVFNQQHHMESEFPLNPLQTDPRLVLPIHLPPACFNKRTVSSILMLQLYLNRPMLRLLQTLNINIIHL